MTEIIFGSITIPAVVAGIVVWFSKAVISERLKKAIQNEYDQKLETYKNELKYQSDLNLEKLRSELNIIEKEKEIILFKLQEKRAQVVGELYEKLINYYYSLKNYVAQVEYPTDPPKMKRRKKALDLMES